MELCLSKKALGIIGLLHVKDKKVYLDRESQLSLKLTQNLSSKT
jgi:hypothetical protein